MSSHRAFRPAMYHSSLPGTGVYMLPGPQLDPPELAGDFDAKTFKIPLAKGDRRHGISPNGLTISLKGYITVTYLQADNTPTVLLGEEQMWDESEKLKSRIDRRGEMKYEFFLFFDETDSLYRKYKCCTTVNFTMMMDPHAYTYSLTIHAEDPTQYTGAPGV